MFFLPVLFLDAFFSYPQLLDFYIKNGDLDGIHTLLEQTLRDSVDIDNIWPLIESDIKRATKAIQE